MQFLLRGGWLLWICLGCALPFSLPAQVGRNIQKIEIRHVGPPAVSDELVRANLRVKVGDAYDRASINGDVRNLYATGYFYDVRVTEEISDPGVILTYLVQGKPLLTEIRFEGNTKYSADKLQKKVTSKIGEPLNEPKLFTDAQEIQKMYQKAGFQKTEVKYRTAITENLGRGTVTFEVKESPKVKIGRVEFVGAQAFSQKKLRKVIKTRRRWAFSWLTGTGILKDEQFQEDREKLTDFYRKEGYIDFDIKDVKFDFTSPNRMNIRIEVFEGKQYKVGAVDFKGNKLFTTNELAPMLRMAPGATFTPQGLMRDRGALVDFYESRGYLNPLVVPLRTANTERGTMDLVYQVEEVEKSYIEKIEIKGNTKTKDRVIRRELAVSPGEVFDMVRVKVSTNRLYGLGYFSKVESEVEPTEVPNRKNLIIGVEETGTGQFDLGAGFSSIDNLIGFVGITQGNFDLFNPPYFTGGGQRFRIRATLGTRRKDYVLSFVEPWFLNRKLELDVDLYHRQLNYFSDLYDQTQTGVSLGLVKALTRNIRAGVSYTIENVGIDLDPALRDPTISLIQGPGREQSKNILRPAASDELLAEQGNTLVSKIGTSLTYDTRNYYKLPNKGTRTSLTAELAGGPMGGETDFFKLELTSSWYFKGFMEGHVIELTGMAGVVESYGDSTRVPLFDRFFLGGANSLRGYKYRHVGPKDDTGEPIGGGTYWFGSLEYSIPIIERLRVAAFYDIGNVYSSPFRFNPNKAKGETFYSDNWGFGIRIDIPQFGAPLRLDYGIPITHDRFNSDSGKFQFGVGYTKIF